MLCPLQIESNQLSVVPAFEVAGKMGPKNETFLQRQNSTKEMSWIDRMQLKLETLCEIDSSRNPHDMIQETSSYLENQMTTVGTNMRKFCAEFVRELLLPPTSPDKVDIAQADGLQADLGQNLGGQTGTEKRTKLVDGLVFDPEGSSTGEMSPSSEADLCIEVQQAVEGHEAVPVNTGTNPPVLEVPSAVPVPILATAINEDSEQGMGISDSMEGDAEQYAQWFVSEEYRKMRIGKSTSTTSLQSWDGHQRAPSTDSLLDWEFI